MVIINFAGNFEKVIMVKCNKISMYNINKIYIFNIKKNINN